MPPGKFCVQAGDFNSKMCNGSEMTLVEPGSDRHYIEPASAAIESALTFFFYNEALLTTRLCGDIHKGEKQFVQIHEVERLRAQVQLVGAALDAHEPTASSLLDPRIYVLVLTRHLSPTIRWGSGNPFPPVPKGRVHRLEEGDEYIQRC